MAKKIEFGKFLILEMDREEIVDIFQSPGICDWCGRFIPGKGYYIAVLNSVYDKDCFENWKKRATYYPSDAPVERRNYEYVQCKLQGE